jgi:adenosylcobinamide-phosphate synthase
MRRDAAKHASPNAGWPEAAMAGALKVRLGGPATYDGIAHERPVFAAEAAAPTAADLARGLAVYRGACLLLFAGAAAWGLSRERVPQKWRPVLRQERAQAFRRRA